MKKQVKKGRGYVVCLRTEGLEASLSDSRIQASNHYLCTWRGEERPDIKQHIGHGHICIKTHVDIYASIHGEKTKRQFTKM